MKKINYIVSMLLLSKVAFSQEKIGTNPTIINSNAVLELEATNKGFLLPRVELTSTDSSTPLSSNVAGMTVYNTATAGTAPNNVTPGVYFNDGTKWIRVGDESLTGKTILNGTSNPTTQGNIGDFYINTSANTIFGPKTVGGWGIGTSLVGPQGVAGPAGPGTFNGTTNYLVKFTDATTGGNSLLQDNGTSLSINTTPTTQYTFSVNKTQLTATGDAQASIYGYRTRDSQNNGISYAHSGVNNAIQGYNYWGDIYTFGVSGHCYNDYSRTGGVLGADVIGGYWGSLGYRSSGLVNYGVYGSSGYTSGAGFLPSSELVGIGGGFFGGIVGSMCHGQIIGQINSGELFASYNSGNTYTTGKNVELVGTEGTEKTPVYAVTSVDAVIYSKGNFQLVNGEAYVAFDNNYKNLLGETPVVTVSPNGNCNGLYIASVDKNGFTVKEMNNGTNTVAISWIAVGNRIDNRMEEATRIVSAANFDRNVEQILFDDGNKDGKASAIWWDGEKIQFGNLPDHLAKVKRSESDRK